MKAFGASLRSEPSELPLHPCSRGRQRLQREVDSPYSGLSAEQKCGPRSPRHRLRSTRESRRAQHADRDRSAKARANPFRGRSEEHPAAFTTSPGGQKLRPPLSPPPIAPTPQIAASTTR